MRWPWSPTKLPEVRFAVLFPGRTGSSFLVSALASHPDVHVEGEGLVRLDAQAQQAWLGNLYDTPRKAQTVGFKTKLKDVRDPHAFADALRTRGVRILVLRRRNLVKLAVSTLNARRLHEQTGRWNRRGDDPGLGPLEVAPEELARAIAGCAAAQDDVERFAASLALPLLALDYEDLLRDPNEWLSRACAFIGASTRPLDSKVAKATNDDLRVALADYERHARHFRETPHARDFSAET